jgi:hypothetical protein
MTKTLFTMAALCCVVACAMPTLAGENILMHGHGHGGHRGHHHGGAVYEGPDHGGAVYEGHTYGGIVYEGDGGAMGGYGAPPGAYGQWHAGYYHVMYGKPLALVVPPTLTHQTNWGWGVGNTRVTPIYPQFIGPMTATSYGGNERFRPTPFHPSDTLQFGVYYIRGPW